MTLTKSLHGKRIISALTVLAMLAAMMMCLTTMFPLKASAAVGSVSIGGVSVSSPGGSNDFGSGWEWDYLSQTLTLTGTGTTSFSGIGTAAIRIMCAAADTVNIIVNGNITLIGGGSNSAIMCDGGINIGGTGSLTISTSGGYSHYGINAVNGDITIGAGVNVSINSDGDGICADGSSNGGNVVIDGTVSGITSVGGHGIYANGDVTINGTVGNITANNSTKNGIYTEMFSNGNVTINGSVASIDAGNAGIFSEGGDVIINGTLGDIGTSSGHGIYADNDVVINAGSTVGTIEGNANGICADNTGTITINSPVTVIGNSGAFNKEPTTIFTPHIATYATNTAGTVDVATSTDYKSVYSATHRYVDITAPLPDNNTSQSDDNDPISRARAASESEPPKTDASNNIALWITLLGTSALCIIILTALRRYHNA